jgi:DNA-binding transcriptional MerR regulator
MAKLHCVSEKTLRLYQEEGLLEPCEIDPDTGYRYYSLDQSSQLDMITQLKAIGMPLKEIADILRRRDIRYFYGMVERQAAGIEERIRQLQAARRAAEHLLATCGSCLAKPVLDELSIQEFGPRRLLRFDIEAYPLSGGAGAGQASGALEAWERCLRQVKRIFVDNDLPLSLFSNVGCVVRREDLAARNFIVSGAFIFVDADFSCPGDMRVEDLPGGSFLAVCCDGMSTADGAYRESQYLTRLLDWIEERGYVLAGDYIGEVLAETPAFLYSGRDMMVRLQIPIALPPGS